MTKRGDEDIHAMLLEDSQCLMHQVEKELSPDNLEAISGLLAGISNLIEHLQSK